MTKKVRFNKADRNLMDQDYFSKLTDEDKAWLNQFNKEYYEAIYPGDERLIHSEEYDEELREARSARRKDLWNAAFSENRLDSGDRNFVENNMDVYSEDTAMWFEEEMDKLEKIDEKTALSIIREQAKDMIKNEIDILEDILVDFQRDTIKIWMNSRKNK